MAQYTTGTVDVENGVATVEGEGVDWSALSTPAMFKLDVDGAPVYEIASFTDSDTLVLSAVYAGTTEVDQTYQIVTDFSPNMGWPQPQQGDADAADWLRRWQTELDTEFFYLMLSMNKETLAATKTLTMSSRRLQWLNPDASDRIVILPGPTVSITDSNRTAVFFVYNSGSSGDLEVQDPDNGRVAIVANGELGIALCDGVSWICFVLEGRSYWS
jgi:hypothetical protein